MFPKYDLDKIKFATDSQTFEKAIDIYESGKIFDFKEDVFGFMAKVHGSKSDIYDVSISERKIDEGDCECYMGQNDYLCKHMVAVAIYAVLRGKKMKQEDKKVIENPKCSERLGVLSDQELAEVKNKVTEALKYIKAYTGPSRIWFAYQSSLSEGCARLSEIVSNLPVSEQTANLLIDLALRLDKKMCTGGVDDSDGTVGGFIEEVVGVLIEYAKLDVNCVKAFKKLKDKETCFGWEEPLITLFD